MHRGPRRGVIATAVAIALAAAVSASAQSALAVTTPKQHFGFNIGDDYQLATYTQFVAYWQKLDKESERMKVVEIGKTAEGRPQLMAIISSPENLKKLDRYKEISARLAQAEGLTPDQARALSKEGKGVVWIDGGLHATEVLGAHQLIETVYQLVSRTDAETTRFLNDLVILAVHANPDGMELVSSWYMRESDPTRRSTSQLPRLYQKYLGHDNNRDFYLSSQPESTNMNRVMYLEWFPQIMYNHHQTGPAGTVMFAPPFRDPFNYHFDPMIPAQLDLVAAAMHSRFAAEGKPGVTSRRGANYSTWWNGGLRTMAYFHNMIGLLTETIGSPTPMTIPFLPSKQLPDSNLHAPIEPQPWHFRQSIDYSVTANYAVFDIASRNKENFLFNIYQMGKNSIDRGNRDHWTATPRRVIAATATLSGGREGRGDAPGGDEPGGRGGRGGGAVATAEDFKTLLRDPAARDPRGFILPSDQPDFPTATKFVNALLKTGVTVHRATTSFTVAGKTYPAGSYVVKSAQAFRPHVLDMFEPQDHPDDIPYPGGPPSRPYDSAGWTLAYQMGVKFDRILDGFDGPFEKVSGLQKAPAGKVTAASAGYTFSHAINDSFTAINRLVAAGEDVSRSPADRSRARSSCSPSRPRQRLSRRSPPISGSVSKGLLRSPPATPLRFGRSASRWPISTAGRCRPAGRASCWSSSNSPSRSSIRKRSTWGICRAAMTSSSFRPGWVRRPLAADAVAGVPGVVAVGRLAAGAGRYLPSIRTSSVRTRPPALVRSSRNSSKMEGRSWRPAVRA